MTQLRHRLLILLTLIALTIAATSSPAKAIPAFARKYNLSCTSCHTKAPRLNIFGEAFHMAGYQIPATREGELRKKRQIGRIVSEKSFLNIFALRATGNFVESVSGGNPVESNLALPREIELYFAGTFTDEISYFFNLSNEIDRIQGLDDEGHNHHPHGHFEAQSEFGLGKEFFLMFDLGPSIREKTFSHMGESMMMGPMLMLGKIDPSTNFSYPTNRQFILNHPGHIDRDTNRIRRFTLTPYAFASKFFGLQTAEGKSLEVSKEVLYNTAGGFGLDVHMMLGRWMLQAGIMQGIAAGSTDVNEKKDPYLMTRFNFGGRQYFSGSVSALANWGNDTAMIHGHLIDWFRYGFAANIKYKLLDIYGAMIWDEIRGLPETFDTAFDSRALGLSLEADFIMTDQHLISLRYDQMEAGGFINQKSNAKVLTVQIRKYYRDNFALFIRDTVNVGTVSENPLQNFRNLIAIGIDFDF